MRKFLIVFFICFFGSFDFLFADDWDGETEFNDVEFDDEYFHSLQFLKSRKLIKGYEDGTFRPDNQVNRAEALALVLRGAGVDFEKEVCKQSPFPDVPVDSWFCNIVKVGKEKKIIRGYEDGNFRPNKKVNRVEIFAMFTFAVGIKDKKISGHHFLDIPDGEWYSNVSNVVFEKNLFEFDAGKLIPNKNVSRGEVARMSYRELFCVQNKIDKYNSSFVNSVVSFYGDQFEGKQTSSGDIFWQDNFSSAHQTIGNGTISRACNDKGCVVFYVNDFGPVIEDREFDFSRSTFGAIGEEIDGLAKISVNIIGEVDDFYKKWYKENFYNEVVFNHKVPNLFLKGEIFFIKGKIAKANEKLILFLADSDEKQRHFFTQSDENGNFEIQVDFIESGNFKMGLVFGDNNTSMLLNVLVLENEFPFYRELKKSEKQVSDLNVEIYDNDVYFSWNILDKKLELDSDSEINEKKEEEKGSESEEKKDELSEKMVVCSKNIDLVKKNICYQKLALEFKDKTICENIIEDLSGLSDFEKENIDANVSMKIDCEKGVYLSESEEKLDEKKGENMDLELQKKDDLNYDNNLFLFEISQSGKTKKFFVNGGNGFFIDRSYLKDFKKGSVKFRVGVANISTNFSIDRGTNFNFSDWKNIVVSESFVSMRDDEKISFDKFTGFVKKGDFIELSGNIKIENLYGKLLVMDPDFKTSRIDFDSVVKKVGSTDFAIKFKAKKEGIYFLEIEDENGTLFLNYPIYCGDFFPLLPNFDDLGTYDKKSDSNLKIEDIREKFLKLINKEREDRGFGKLELNDKLNKVAQFRSDDMKNRKYFSHVDPDGKNVNDIREKFDVKKSLAENIALNFNFDEMHLRLFMSAGHRENILNKDVSQLGIGSAYDSERGFYLTQIFSGDSVLDIDKDDIEKNMIVVINGLIDKEKLKFDDGLSDVCANYVDDIYLKSDDFDTSKIVSDVNKISNSGGDISLFMLTGSSFNAIKEKMSDMDFDINEFNKYGVAFYADAENEKFVFLLIFVK